MHALNMEVCWHVRSLKEWQNYGEGEEGRLLSTVGLMATTDALWPIDATEALCILCLCYGGGSLSAKVMNTLKNKRGQPNHRAMMLPKNC
jgi:hypothetical protein